MKKILALLALAVLLFGCTDTPVPEEPEVVEYGDTVSVNYVLRVDGRVTDTNIESIANSEGIHTGSTTKYQPLQFPVLLGEGLIDGFVSGVVGMEVGESKSFVVSPSEGYGNYDPSLLFNASRYYEMDMVETVPLSYFDERNITLGEGTSFDTDIGTVFIESFNDTHADLVYVFEIGDVFYYGGLPQMVMNSSNYTYTIMIDVIEGGRYTTLSPTTGKLTVLSVNEVGNETITFDENHPLAGKSLDYTVTLLSLTKAEES